MTEFERNYFGAATLNSRATATVPASTVNSSTTALTLTTTTAITGARKVAPGGHVLRKPGLLTRTSSNKESSTVSTRRRYRAHEGDSSDWPDVPTNGCIDQDNNGVDVPVSAVTILSDRQSANEERRTSSLRKNVPVKKEVNFVSPTRANPKPISHSTTLPHNFTLWRRQTYGDSDITSTSATTAGGEHSIGALSGTQRHATTPPNSYATGNHSQPHSHDIDGNFSWVANVIAADDHTDNGIGDGRDRHQQSGHPISVHNVVVVGASKAMTFNSADEDYNSAMKENGDTATVETPSAVTYYSDSTGSNSIQQCQIACNQQRMERNKCYSSSLSLSNLEKAKWPVPPTAMETLSLAPTADCKNNGNRFGTMRSIQSDSQAHNSSTMTRNGSLRRSKGKSNQSLCSCDAETEINLAAKCDKPLIEYDQDGGNSSSGHTYTCEQNAQILLRLERERQLKKLMASSTGKLNKVHQLDPEATVLGCASSTSEYLLNGSSSINCGSGKDSLKKEKGHKAWTFGRGRRMEQKFNDDTMIDYDIPPPPGPPQLRRNLSVWGQYQLPQQQQQQTHHCSNNAHFMNHSQVMQLKSGNCSEQSQMCPGRVQETNLESQFRRTSVHVCDKGNFHNEQHSNLNHVNRLSSQSLAPANQYQLEENINDRGCQHGAQLITNKFASISPSPSLSSSSASTQIMMQPHVEQIRRIINGGGTDRDVQLGPGPNYSAANLLRSCQINSIKNINNNNNNNGNIIAYSNELIPYNDGHQVAKSPQPDICNVSTAAAEMSELGTQMNRSDLFGFEHVLTRMDACKSNYNNDGLMKHCDRGTADNFESKFSDQHSTYPHHQIHHQVFNQHFKVPRDVEYPTNNNNFSSSDEFNVQQPLHNCALKASLASDLLKICGEPIMFDCRQHKELPFPSISSQVPAPHLVPTNPKVMCSYTNNKEGFNYPCLGSTTLLGTGLGMVDLLENGRLMGTANDMNSAAALMKQRELGAMTSANITPAQSISSMMPWRHRICCSSRGSSSSGASSTRWEFPARHWLVFTSILLIAGAAGVAVPLALRVTASAPFEERLEAATQLLVAVPLIDGHNDLPWNIRKFLHNQLNDFQFDIDLRTISPWSKSTWSHTDLTRLHKGKISAQFWAAYVPCEAQHRDAVQLTLEQIDVIKRLTDRYSPQLTTCTSVDDIVEAHKNNQLCSLTGVEGGHSIGGSLGVLRTFYGVGVRLMTLTSTCHTPWADSSQADAPKFDVKHGGLTTFGKTIIREMNRLGMIVDLSHTSVGTMRDALATSEAPVIFSHSSAYELCNSSRNVQNSILEAIAKNRGLVMINFYSRFLSCSENATVHDAVAHINHIKKVAGIDHVGIGAGFDGINYTPKGLEDVSSYPVLFAELLGDGWTVEELTKLAGQNFLRVMREVEGIRDKQRLQNVRPYEDIPNFRPEDSYNCTSS